MRAKDKAGRGEPHACTFLSCKNSSRHRGSLYDRHWEDTMLDKNTTPATVSRVSPISGTNEEPNTLAQIPLACRKLDHG